MNNPAYSERRPYPNNGDFSSRYGNILQTMTVVGVALGGVYAGVVVPLETRITDNRDKIYALTTEMGRQNERQRDQANSALDKKLSLEEHQEFKLRHDKQLDVMHEEILTNKRDIDIIREQQVSRNEHVTHWDQAKENVAEMRKQIDDLRKDFGGQYTISEKIKDLQQQLSEMRKDTATSHVSITGPAAVPPINYQMPPVDHK